MFVVYVGLAELKEGRDIIKQVNAVNPLCMLVARESLTFVDDERDFAKGKLLACDTLWLLSFGRKVEANIPLLADAVAKDPFKPSGRNCLDWLLCFGLDVIFLPYRRKNSDFLQEQEPSPTVVSRCQHLGVSAGKSGNYNINFSCNK
eukprot:m.87827 g.87827  ORF g.87827 m.87827 type:complete len:147 (-) comp13129_c2_seq9:1199-1639(-)